MNQNNSTIVLALGSGGDNGITYTLQGPINLTGATFTFVVNFDAGAAASADLNVAFQDWSPSGAEWWQCGLWGFSADQDTIYSCSDLHAIATDSETATVRLYMAPNAGTATIKSATLQLAP